MLICLPVTAQEGLPFYDHYLLSDNYLINPSYAGANPDVLRVRATHYSQWAGLEDAPSLQTLSAHTRIVNRLSGGLYVFNDRNGATSLRGFNLSAAYHIPIGDSYGYYGEEDNKFSFGLSYNGFSQVFDRTKWNIQHPDDPLLDVDSYFLNYFNIGASFNYQGIYAGVSILDIPLGDHRPIVNSIEPLPTWYYILVGYKFNVTEGIELQPSVLLNLNSNSERQMDLTLRSRFAMGENGVQLGVNYRMDSDALGTQNLALTPLVNLEIGQLRIGYAYKMGLSDISREFGEGHLISLGYDFGNPFNIDPR